MYPYIRFATTILKERRRPALGLFDPHSLWLTCLPWDIDGLLEMNNGRVLTLYDFGRFSLAVRMGLADVARREGWGFVVAGSSVRYRARITMFQRFELRTRLLGWDARFVYMEQAMWRGETCCNHALLRTGVTKKGRLIPTADVASALGQPNPEHPIPDWAKAWTEADATRPWPPAV